MGIFEFLGLRKDAPADEVSLILYENPMAPPRSKFLHRNAGRYAIRTLGREFGEPAQESGDFIRDPETESLVKDSKVVGRTKYTSETLPLLLEWIRDVRVFHETSEKPTEFLDALMEILCDDKQKIPWELSVEELHEKSLIETADIYLCSYPLTALGGAAEMARLVHPDALHVSIRVFGMELEQTQEGIKFGKAGSHGCPLSIESYGTSKQSLSQIIATVEDLKEGRFKEYHLTKANCIQFADELCKVTGQPRVRAGKRNVILDILFLFTSLATSKLLPGIEGDGTELAAIEAAWETQDRFDE